MLNLSKNKFNFRFVDIRTRHHNDKLDIYHGISYQHAELNEVIADTLTFLNNNPEEFILMSIKKEDPAVSYVCYLKKCFETHINLFDGLFPLEETMIHHIILACPY